MLHLFTAAVAAAVLAAPASALALDRRANPCAGIADGVSTLPGDFQLAVLNTTGTNANSTGNPLIVGQTSSTSGVESFLTSPWGFAKYGVDKQTTFNLTGGALVTASSPAGAVGEYVNNGNGLFFDRGWPGWPTVSPGTDYCVTPVDGHQRLAAHGRTDLFSVCTNQWQPTVYYNATAFWQNWHQLSDCYPVVVNVLDVASGGGSSASSTASSTVSASSSRAPSSAGGATTTATVTAHPTSTQVPSTTVTATATVTSPAQGGSGGSGATTSGAGSGTALPVSTPSGSSSHSGSGSGTASNSATVSGSGAPSTSANAALGSASTNALLAGVVGALAWLAA